MRSIYSLFLLTLFILTGCSNPFHPNLDNNGTGNPEYTVATTPDEVLKNLALAYNRQDINIYKLCLAKDFRFELLAFDVNEIGIDMNGDGINDSWWDYDHELAYHANLFRKGTIMSNGYPAPDAIHLTLDVPPFLTMGKRPYPGTRNLGHYHLLFPVTTQLYYSK